MIIIFANFVMSLLSSFSSHNMKHQVKFSTANSAFNSHPAVKSTSLHVDHDVPVFSTENTVENQTIADSETTIVSCLFCKASFASLSAYECHSCRVSVVKKPELTSYTCLDCNEEFSKLKFLQKHHCTLGQHKCLVCPSRFLSKSLLRKHLNTVHCVSKTIKGYSCKFCKGIFIKRYLFYNHLKKHANSNDVKLCEKSYQGDEKSELEDDVSTHTIHCDYCDQSFDRKQQYEQHMHGHERYMCALCKTSFSTKRLYNKHQHAIHGIKTENKRHKCPTCHKLFQRPFHLSVHQRIHTGEKPIQCRLCRKSFCTEQALAKHKKTAAHSKKELGGDGNIEKTFLCEKCGRMFYHQQTLARHSEQIHKCEKYLQCPQCEYKTKYEANLKRHIELHANIKRFICEICGASFNAQATLKSHHSYVHSEKRDFICEFCSKAFKGKSALQRHLRNHSSDRPFKCHCNQTYKRMSHLKRHMSSAHQITVLSKKLDKCSNHKETDSVPQVNLYADSIPQINLNIDSIPQINLQIDSDSVVQLGHDSINKDFQQSESESNFQTFSLDPKSFAPEMQNFVCLVLSQNKETDKEIAGNSDVIDELLNVEKHVVKCTSIDYCDESDIRVTNHSVATGVKTSVADDLPSHPLQTFKKEDSLTILPASPNDATNACEVNLLSNSSFFNFPDYDSSTVLVNSLLTNSNLVSSLPDCETIVKEKFLNKPQDELKLTSSLPSFSYGLESLNHTGMEWTLVDTLKCDDGSESVHENCVNTALNSSYTLQNSLDDCSSPFIFPNESQVSLQDTIPHLELDLFSTSMC